MTTPSLFPELEPKPPDWPGHPTLVVSAFVQHGGRCGHCDEYLVKDKAIHKLAPACCRNHIRIQKRAKNGPGIWVCHPCFLDLKPRKE